MTAPEMLNALVSTAYQLPEGEQRQRYTGKLVQLAERMLDAELARPDASTCVTEPVELKELDERLTALDRRAASGEYLGKVAGRVTALEGGARTAQLQRDELNARIQGLETALQVHQVAYKVEPRPKSRFGESDPIDQDYARRERQSLFGAGDGITVIVHDLGENRSLEGFSNEMHRLCPNRILVDAGGLGAGLLRYLEQAGLPAEALPKGGL